jgi:hypothetical protein
MILPVQWLSDPRGLLFVHVDIATFGSQFSCGSSGFVLRAFSLISPSERREKD